MGSPSEQVMRHKRILQLTSALAQLPDDQRQALELYYLQGCTVAEVAEVMARSERSIAGLVRRGLQKLREPLSDGEETIHGL